jgi:hypothetical protein
MARDIYDAKTRPTGPISQTRSKELQHQLPSPARQPPLHTGGNTTPMNNTQSTAQAVPSSRPTN